MRTKRRPRLRKKYEEKGKIKTREGRGIVGERGIVGGKGKEEWTERKTIEKKEQGEKEQEQEENRGKNKKSKNRIGRKQGKEKSVGKGTGEEQDE